MIQFLVFVPPVAGAVEEVVEKAEGYREPKDCQTELCQPKPTGGLPPDLAESNISPVRIPNAGFTVGGSGTTSVTASYATMLSGVHLAGLQPLDPADTPRWLTPFRAGPNSTPIWAVASNMGATPDIRGQHSPRAVNEEPHSSHLLQTLSRVVRQRS